MQTNTGYLRNRRPLASRKLTKTGESESDPFTVVDGRFVGDDGFVVPRNFEEFNRRFPTYVHDWVKRHSRLGVRPEDIEDWTQDLTIHLMALPPCSTFRAAGKEDLIQTFDPHRHHGANQARFRNYINLCLANKFRTMYVGRMKNPVCVAGTLSLRTHSSPDEVGCVDDEYCHEHSSHLKQASTILQRRDQKRLLIAEFAEFVREHEPAALVGIKAISATKSIREGAQFLGITEKAYIRLRTRLRQSGQCFKTVNEIAAAEQRGDIVSLSVRQKTLAKLWLTSPKSDRFPTTVARLSPDR